jgi:hypothetical protein
VTVVNGVRLVSNSELQSFKWCRRNWWLAWHRGLAPHAGDNVASAAATGGRIHEALAGYYVPDGEPRANPLVTLRAAQERDLAVHVGRTFGPDDPLSDDNERLLAEAERTKLESNFILEARMIEGYIEWLAETGVDAEWEVIGSEEYVEARFTQFVPFAGEEVKLIGKLDARVRSRITGQVKFIDHKSVGTLDDPILGLNQQMLHYNVIGWLLGWGVGAGAIYNMLRKVKRTRASKPPYYARVLINHNQVELNTYVDKLIGTISNLIDVGRQLESGASHQRVAYPTPGRDCAWKCRFFKVCRMLDDGSRAEAALSDLYEARDPLAYYGGREKIGDELA